MTLVYTCIATVAGAAPMSAPSGTQWPQIILLLAGVLVAATVPVVLYAKTRRDRRHETASAEERRAATELHELIVSAEVNGAVSYDGPTSGCDGPVSSYGEWLTHWKRRTGMLLPRLPPVVRARLIVLTHLLERVAQLGGPYRWSLAVRFAIRDVDAAVDATLTGTPSQPQLLPEKDLVDDLMARGAALGASAEPLVDEIMRRSVEHIGQTASAQSRRERRWGIVFGVYATLSVGALIGSIVVLVT